LSKIHSESERECPRNNCFHAVLLRCAFQRPWLYHSYTTACFRCEL
jgi:hypothetical protein